MTSSQLLPWKLKRKMGKVPNGLSSRISSPGKLRATRKLKEVGSASINECDIDVVC